jgi:hypothetical protein
MTKPDTVPFERLADWLEHRLSPAEAAAVARQAERAGPETRRRIAWLRAFLGARAAVVVEAPPPGLRAALLRQFQPPARPPGPLRRVVAALSFDSAAAPAPAGVRAVEARARQLIFACELVEVALSLRPGRRSDRLDVNGQVYPRGPGSAAGLVARLSRGEDLVDISLTSDLGEFSFSALPPGPYQLELFVEDSAVLIDAFPVELNPGP